jgi:hypothetical protein
MPHMVDMAVRSAMLWGGRGRLRLRLSVRSAGAHRWRGAPRGPLAAAEPADGCVLGGGGSRARTAGRRTPGSAWGVRCPRDSPALNLRHPRNSCHRQERCQASGLVLNRSVGAPGWWRHRYACSLNGGSVSPNPLFQVLDFLNRLLIYHVNI